MFQNSIVASWDTEGIAAEMMTGTRKQKGTRAFGNAPLTSCACRGSRTTHRQKGGQPNKPLFRPWPDRSPLPCSPFTRYAFSMYTSFIHPPWNVTCLFRARLVACEESIPIPMLAFLRCTPSVHGRSYVCTWVYKCAPINLKKILKYLCVLIYSFRLGV
jgi:hypothetical protein